MGVYHKTDRPVVVKVAEFVGESLHMIWLESRCVTYHIEVGGRDSALTHTLTHKEEVIPATKIQGREIQTMGPWHTLNIHVQSY